MLLLLVIWALVWALLQLVDMLAQPHARIFRILLLGIFVVWLLWAFIAGGPSLRAG